MGIGYGSGRGLAYQAWVSSINAGTEKEKKKFYQLDYINIF